LPRSSRLSEESRERRLRRLSLGQDLSERSRSERSERDSSDAGIALGLDLAERNDYTSLGYTQAHFAEADLPLHLRLALARSRPATSGMSSGSLSRTSSSGGSSLPRSSQLSEGSRERRLRRRRLSFGQDLSERSRSGGLSTALSETARLDAAREKRGPEQAPRHVTALVCVGALRRTHTWAIWDHTTFPLVMMRPSPARKPRRPTHHSVWEKRALAFSHTSLLLLPLGPPRPSPKGSSQRPRLLRRGPGRLPRAL